MKNGKLIISIGSISTIAFAIWTVLIMNIDVQPVGQNETEIGFATLNYWFHRVTGVNMILYTITDWMGLIPLCICVVFGVIGFKQLIIRRSLFKVDCDIIILGVYYLVVIFSYLIFEIIPINYRPILIEGYMEVSYPSSTTLLVLCVMPTLVEQMNRRMKNMSMKNMIDISTIIFTIFMVVGRLVSGVHWLTDIIGAILLSTGLFNIYKGTILLCNRKENK